MPSLEKYRRTYFALLRETGLAEEDRHWLQESLTTKPSTKDWNAEDWRTAIAALQRDLGQHNDVSAHVREDRPAGERRREEWATPPQCDLIESLSDKVPWRTGRARGPVRYLLATVLARPGKELRARRVRAAAQDQAVGTAAIWPLLTKHEASDFILAVRQAADVYTRQEAAHAQP